MEVFFHKPDIYIHHDVDHIYIYAVLLLYLWYFIYYYCSRSYPAHILYCRSDPVHLDHLNNLDNIVHLVRLVHLVIVDLNNPRFICRYHIYIRYIYRARAASCMSYRSHPVATCARRAVSWRSLPACQSYKTCYLADRADHILYTWYTGTTLYSILYTLYSILYTLPGILVGI